MQTVDEQRGCSGCQPKIGQLATRSARPTYLHIVALISLIKLVGMTSLFGNLGGDVNWADLVEDALESEGLGRQQTAALQQQLNELAENSRDGINLMFKQVCTGRAFSMHIAALYQMSVQMRQHSSSYCNCRCRQLQAVAFAADNEMDDGNNAAARRIRNVSFACL